MMGVAVGGSIVKSYVAKRPRRDHDTSSHMEKGGGGQVELAPSYNMLVQQQKTSGSNTRSSKSVGRSLSHTSPSDPRRDHDTPSHMLMEGKAACEGEALQPEDDDLKSLVTKFLSEGRKEVGEKKAKENRRRVS